MPSLTRVPCLHVIALSLVIPGCRNSISAESLFKDSIAQKNNLADLISNSASPEKTEVAQAKVDDLQAQLNEKEKIMSKVKWNKLWFKYRARIKAANERLNPDSGDTESSPAEN